MSTGGCEPYDTFDPSWADVVRDAAPTWRHGVDGTDVSLTYEDWDAGGEPVDDPTKTCVHNRYGDWEVASCDTPAYFACEFDMEPEDGPDSPCFPTVVLDTGSRPYDKPFQLLRAGDFSTFGSIVHLDCPGDYNITYKWRLRVEVEHNDPTVLMDESYQRLTVNGIILNDSSITIPRNTLKPGKYLLVLSVSVTYGENNDVTTAIVSTWIEIEGSTRRILITGGSKRSQSGGYLMDARIDAEVHDDAEFLDLHPHHSGQWIWTCRLPNGDDCGLWVSVKEYAPDRYSREIEYDGHMVSVSPFTTSGTFIMRVEYRDYIPYEQEVTLLPRGLPTCMVRCSPGDNCNHRATKFDQRLRLWTECQKNIPSSYTYGRWVTLNRLGPEHSFHWSLKQFPDGFSDGGLENNTLTGLEKRELIVKSDVFTVPGEYIIRLDILTNGVLCTSGNCSYAEWKFLIPVPPANARQPVCTEAIPVPLASVECNGNQSYSAVDRSWPGEGCECREVSNLCTAGPTEGIALTTRFDLSCLDFEAQGAIRYEFYYRTRATASVSTLTTSESGHNNLFYYGMSPSPLPFKLPSGLASDDYKVFIFVQMIDQEGTSKTSELELTVRLPTFEDLLTAIDVTNAEVETAIRWGNKMEAVHLSTITAATLNNIRAEGAYGDGDWREARQGIIYNVGRVPIESVESVIQSSESLIQATHYDDQVTADAQVSTSAAAQLYNMAKFVTQKVTEGNITQDMVERLSGIIFTGAFNVFKSSEVVADWKHNGNGPPEDANTAEVLSKNRYATTTAYRYRQPLTDQILKGKRLTEFLTMISSQDFQNITGDIEGAQLRAIRNTFCRANRLGTQVFHSRWRNPFEYATNFSHRDLDIGIGGLHFSDALEKKGISDLEEPIEFSILRHNQSVVTTGFDDVGVDGTVVFTAFTNNVSISTADTFIFLTPKDPLMSPTFTLYLAYGIKPNATLNLFDLNTTLPTPANMSYSLYLSMEENATRTVTSDPYSWRVRLGDVEISDSNDTNWYLGIEPTSVDGMDDEGRPKQSGSVSFSVYIEPVECVFFNEEDHSWDRSGCEVGPLTTTTHLHCRCDHLTKFSGLTGLVSPHEINFERALKGFLLKNLIQNPIGIMTCCVLFSFYIALCVPWTRKNDAKDLGKITTAAIFDDTKHPKPRYYLRVFTGPRANAGTTAKVSIMLHGSTRECGPFLLHQPYSAMFEKGNMAGFVLCTETDPGWLTHVRVWHDNSGKEPSWFLDRIIVDDLLLEEQHYFLCNRWLAFDEDDEQIERVLPAAKDEQLVAFSTLFADRTTKDLRDGHIWYSVYGRPASSPFTRTQRVSCCLSIIMCTMLANIMFFGRGDDFDPPEPVTVFGFDVEIPISWPQVHIL
ncbi:polycystic kidney disease protein 1-like 2 [Branchiostoma floridae]|uniref:Polycystic kidney disease protein 1-like 2 n=1 Tax=Branchiostoma floridae TaxID=7739 RepID=A0A9J7NA82_BRAFL|nr:polycystic kidney disease protein 1-like 2 [Branchiostoma floridae]